MHYHNVFLVRASNKLSALKLTEMFLEPYSEQKEVDPYKDYLTDNDIERMCKHYKIDPNDKGAVLDKLLDWDGDAGGYDEHGKLFHWRTYNPDGEWDWKQWGGRWSWWDYYKEYRDVLFKEYDPETGSGTYWNRFHDSEVAGKKATVTFPDGTVQRIDYGTAYPFQTWCNDHPEMFEVKDATDPKFFELIETGIKSHYKSVTWWEKQKEEHESKDDPSDMASWYQKKLDKSGQRWGTATYFWNITENSFGYNKEEILEEPERWFLVNVDLHS